MIFCMINLHTVGLTSLLLRKYATSISIPYLNKNLNPKEYLSSSFIPTNHFQDSLPHLPIPGLEETCKRYLKSQQALAHTHESYRYTEKCVKKFLANEGPALQKELREMDAKHPHTSYISNMWFDYYLKDRRPIALNSNPFISIRDDPRPAYNDQLLRATNLVVSSLRFLKSYENNTLAPDVYHLKPDLSETMAYKWMCRMTPKQFAFFTSYMFSAFPLDMSQYRNLFCSTRVPRLGRDEIINDPMGRPNIVVAVGGRLYSIDVLEVDGTIKPVSLIYSLLHHLKLRVGAEKSSGADATNVGLCTALLDRNQWATVRDDLIAVHPTNYTAFSLIDNALYVLCLDDFEACDKTNAAEGGSRTTVAQTENLARNFLLCPSGSTVLNRWFDKSFQLIVTKDGKTAVNMEHSWGDGVSVVRFLAEIYQDSIARPALEPSAAHARGIASEKLITPIEFKLTPALETKLGEVRKKLLTLNESFKINATKYEGFGKNFIKSNNLSPDAILQLSFQMANYKLVKQVSSTYESCSTAAFKHGRTETIRPATLDTRTFCETFLEKDYHLHSDAAIDMIKSCSKMHSVLTRQAAMGQGFDRHLFALKRLAEDKSGSQPNKLPSIYTDPAYAAINHVILSTSTVESKAVEMGGFGPVVPEGLGISYGFEPECLGVFATSYDDVTNAKRPLNSKDFISALTESLNQIRDLLHSKTESRTYKPLS